MYLRLYILVFSVVISVGIRESFAEDSKSKPSTQDEIYLDDEEGSGNREVKDDLEASGSGIGPDDEDGDGSGGKVPLSKAPQREPTGVHTTYTKDVDIGRPDSGSEFMNPNQGSPDNDHDVHLEEDNRHGGADVHIMNAKPDERMTSFFAQPGMLAAVIGGTIVGLLFAILAVMFFVYRMRKKDEGSYPLDEPKRSPTSNSYSKNSNREFYA